MPAESPTFSVYSFLNIKHTNLKLPLRGNSLVFSGLWDSICRCHSSRLSDLCNRHCARQRGNVASYNPCTNVTIPKVEQKEKQIYTKKEVTEILNLLENEPLKYRTFFTLAIFSGFRKGELLGLEWKDVDFDNNIINVRRTSCYTAKKGTYTDTTKTRRSKRAIKFPQTVMDLLKKFKAEQDNEILRIGDKWVETDRLFTKWNGEPMQNGTPYFWLGEFCEKHDLPFYGLHSFRHLFASLLVNNGVDIVTVSGALGHSTVSTTTNVYCHMIEDAQTKVSDAVSNALNFNSKKPTPDEESA